MAHEITDLLLPQEDQSEFGLMPASRAPKTCGSRARLAWPDCPVRRVHAEASAPENGVADGAFKMKTRLDVNSFEGVIRTLTLTFVLASCNLAIAQSEASGAHQ
jgi:hypothetical protein